MSFKNNFRPGNLKRLIGENEIVNRLIEKEELATMYGEMIRFIRINQNSPEIIENLNSIQPAVPFYIESKKFDKCHEMTIPEMMSSKVNFIQ